MQPFGAHCWWSSSSFPSASATFPQLLSSVMLTSLAGEKCNFSYLKFPLNGGLLLLPAVQTPSTAVWPGLGTVEVLFAASMACVCVCMCWLVQKNYGTVTLFKGIYIYTILSFKGGETEARKIRGHFPTVTQGSTFRMELQLWKQGFWAFWLFWFSTYWGLSRGPCTCPGKLGIAELHPHTSYLAPEHWLVKFSSSEYVVFSAWFRGNSTEYTIGVLNTFVKWMFAYNRSEGKESSSCQKVLWTLGRQASVRCLSGGKWSY